jgi:hypothetical protein
MWDSVARVASEAGRRITVVPAGPGEWYRLGQAVGRRITVDAMASESNVRRSGSGGVPATASRREALRLSRAWLECGRRALGTGLGPEPLPHLRRDASRGPVRFSSAGVAPVVHPKGVRRRGSLHDGGARGSHHTAGAQAPHGLRPPADAVPGGLRSHSETTGLALLRWELRSLGPGHLRMRLRPPAPSSSPSGCLGLPRGFPLADTAAWPYPWRILHWRILPGGYCLADTPLADTAFHGYCLRQPGRPRCSRSDTGCATGRPRPPEGGWGGGGR